ncbi:MAG: hypothetical protein RLN79_01405 [Cytophagales bacterium]
MKIIIAVFIVTFFHPLIMAQNGKIYSVEIVCSIAGQTEETIYFYENNWKVFREKAKELNI